MFRFPWLNLFGNFNQLLVGKEECITLQIFRLTNFVKICQGEVTQKGSSLKGVLSFAYPNDLEAKRW